ncbi:mechanosensitive ion channel family protein [Candidatus Woesearchaeota archaeon]|nr:mechanosensitive ion channel family protein [Candidatus Woesearchaeota archaeon]
MASFLQNIYGIVLDKVNSYLPKIATTLVVIIVGYICIKLIIKAIEKFFHKFEFERGVETFIENGVKVILWLILIIIVLANLGVNVSGLVAGLGIMGFVVGFALKDTLGNLASGVFILFYKPFKVHDWVEVGGITGEVVKVGIAACELKAGNQNKITIPNNKIWGDVIVNFSGNKIRKNYDMMVGISYSSNMDQAIKIIKDILKKDDRVLKEPEPQVVVHNLGDSSVNITVRPTTSKDDYWSVHFDTIKKIKEEFDKNKIEIPFPQQDVHIREMPKEKNK